MSVGKCRVGEVLAVVNGPVEWSSYGAQFHNFQNAGNRSPPLCLLHISEAFGVDS